MLSYSLIIDKTYLMKSKCTKKQLTEFLKNYIKTLKNEQNQTDFIDLEATQFVSQQMKQKITFPEFISNLTEQLTKYQKNLFYQMTGSFIPDFHTLGNQQKYIIDLVLRYKGVYETETDSETQNKTLYLAFPGPSPVYCLFRELREYQKIKVKSRGMSYRERGLNTKYINPN